jgi:hypothetical protein
MNAVSFEGREYRLTDRTWEPAGHDGGDLLATLNGYTADLPGPGPADGFTTLGRHLAIQVARDFRGDILELDEVTIPDDAPGTVY